MSGHILRLLGIYSTCFVVGVPGNCWVIAKVGVMLIRNRRHPRRFSINQHIYLYVLALSIVDLLVLTIIPMLITYFLKGSWQFGYVMCKMFWVVENVNKLLSVAILTIMSFERYLTICRPFRKFHYRTRFSVMAVLVTCVTLVILLLLPVIYYANTETYWRLVDNTTVFFKTTCNSDIPDDFLPTFIGYMVTSSFAFPATVSVLCYLAIARHVRSRFARRDETSVIHPFSLYRYRVIISILRVVLFHFICWAPFWLSVVLPLFIEFQRGTFLGSEFVTELRLLTTSLPYINCSLNWVFYALLNRELRSTIRGQYQQRREHLNTLSQRRSEFLHKK